MVQDARSESHSLRQNKRVRASDQVVNIVIRAILRHATRATSFLKEAFVLFYEIIEVELVFFIEQIRT